MNTSDILLNPYNEGVCRQVVQSLKPAIFKKFGSYIFLDFKKFYTDVYNPWRQGTPRLGAILSTLPCASFYYLNFLLELNPEKIVDLGCGINFFKGIIPNIHGVDPVRIANKGYEFDFFGADEIDHFDSEYIKNRQNCFESIFSIDALHFVPINTLSSRIREFVSIIRPGGRGYLSLNAAMLIENTPESNLVELFGTVTPSPEQVENYVTDEIQHLDINFLVIDLCIVEKFQEFIDGNIRLVIQK